MIRLQRKLKTEIKGIAVHKKLPSRRKKPLMLYMLEAIDIN